MLSFRMPQNAFLLLLLTTMIAAWSPVRTGWFTPKDDGDQMVSPLEQTSLLPPTPPPVSGLAHTFRATIEGIYFCGAGRITLFWPVSSR